MSDRDRDRGDRRDRDRDRDRDRERDRGHRRDRSRSRDRDRGRDKDRDRRRDRSRSKEKDNSPPPPPRRKKTTSNWDKDWSGNEVTAASALGDGKVPEILNALVHQAATQPSTKARRIHVGNLPTTGPVDTQTLGEFFDQAMAQAGFKNEVEGTCVKDVWISGEKKFAFIEIRTFEEAERAMGLDGVTLYGCPLRVARPHDYVPPPSAEALQNALAAAGSISSAEAVKIAAAAAMSNPNMLHHVDAAGRVVPTGVNKQITDAAMTALGLQPTAVGSQNMQTLLQASRKCRRVHIGNLPNIPPVTSQQLKEFVCEGMKQMQLCVKPGDPVVDSFVATDGKFGFVELRTVQEASNVLALSGCEYAGRALRISRPTDYQPPTMELVQKLEGTGILGIPGDAGVVLPVMGQGGEMGPDLSRATCVVALKNMMTEAEMNDDEEYKEIIEDTKGKCEEEYGPVSSILAARPGPSECPADKIGQVFVRFPDRETAIKAAEGLHNLKFDGRIVEATFLDENEYEALRKHFPAQPQAEDDPKPAPIPPPPPAPAAPAESAPTEDPPPTEG